jgi:sensor histidine kinase YesM
VPRFNYFAYAAVWLLCIATYVTGITMAGAPLSLAMRGSIAIVLPWAIVGLLVLRVVRRVPWREERRSQFFLVYFVVGLGYVGVTTLGWIGLVVLDRWMTSSTGPFFDVRLLPWQLVNGSMVYAALASVAHAYQNAERVREQSERAARAEVLRAAAELAALRSQLNPHFILNTLHTLLGLVRREPALAEQAIERLGDLLRYGLRLHREAIDEVSLREEWDFVQSYLELEGLRLGDRLQLDIAADDAAMECRVPAFVLQPLVENAIRHAIAPRAAGGRLEVRARCSASTLRLEVRDDGPGASQQTLDAGSGLGLSLLRERLSALYPGAASLRLSPGPPGLHAELELPVRRAGQRV